MANMQIVPASKNVEAQYVEMMVPLYSYGCERKVKKTLSHLKGIYSVNVDYYQQKVTVWGICNKYDVLATMKSKRKEARFWNPEDSIVDQMEESQAQPTNKEGSKPSSLGLMKARSLSWKAWRKVFTRSLSL
ncbi:hypothetical protein P3X46_017390 [Hevea brasiliensis]|uniref:HMA domain-containing protein n=1 Tax=Hevea brasiliensis TaxID=3981 RepID=A0ABQ9M2A2_HEVBR|nr:heavy metal-associated isoprenylated plant protein 28 [Hevea brasiliensis]KAJ9174362.1 hypothetical protein P3X46_017390 [Hevea brasiliensis]